MNRLLTAIDQLISSIRQTPPATNIPERIITASINLNHQSIARLERIRALVEARPEHGENEPLLRDLVRYNMLLMEQILIQQETECFLSGLCESRPPAQIASRLLEIDQGLAAIERTHPHFQFR